MYGLKPGRVKHTFYSPHGEKDPSLYLYETNGQNRFYDFGGGRNVGGDAIQLVMYITGMEWKDALQDLGRNFGLQPISRGNKDDFELSDRQWSRIGLYGDRATKNFEFQLSGPHWEKRCENISQKFNMPMNELRKKHSGVYKSVLERRAFSYVYSCQQQYLHELDSQYLTMKNCGFESLEQMTTYIVENMQDKVDELKLMEQVLKQAMKGTHLKFKFRSYDVAKDFQKIVSGEINMEVGSVSSYDLEMSAKKHDVKLKSLEVDASVFQEIQEMNFNLPYSAVQTKVRVLITAEEKHITILENMERFLKFGLEIDNRNHEGLNEKIAEASKKSSSDGGAKAEPVNER